MECKPAKAHIAVCYASKAANGGRTGWPLLATADAAHDAECLRQIAGSLFCPRFDKSDIKMRTALTKETPMTGLRLLIVLGLITALNISAVQQNQHPRKLPVRQLQAN